MNAPALHPLFHGVSPQGEEKFYQPFVWDNMVGSPPRRRGKVGLDGGLSEAVGITPAQAGKSKLALCTPSCPTDHPRACGEKNKELEGVWLPMGSPPHGRGKEVDALGLSCRYGITPAWAGKSSHPYYITLPRGDHPRVGGEKHPGHRCAGGLNGITPAWAGKRMQVSPKPTLPQDHPRVDGEKILEPSMGVGNFGSPPRGRGKAVKFRCTCGLQRITPALAGKSCRP